MRKIILTAVIAVFIAIGLAVPAHATGAEDPRATIVEGNATTCAAVGFSDDTILSGDNADSNSADGITVTGQANKQYIDVTVDANSNVVLDVIVVKGGPNYNVYPGTVRDNLRSPLNGGGNIPAISHWFICYHAGTVETTTTTTTVVTTTTVPVVTTTVPEVTTTVPETTSTVPGTVPDTVTSLAPAPAPGPDTPTTNELARTGTNTGFFVAFALFLVCAGGTIVHYARRKATS